MNVTVIGCGRWGAMITWYLDKIGHSVTLYGRAGSAHMQSFLKTRSNDLLVLPESVRLCTNLEQSLEGTEIIILSVPSQSLRGVMKELDSLNLRNRAFVLCMKGIEVETGKRLSEIVEENCDSSNSIAVWLGPGHVQEFYSGVPNCMVIDSKDEALKEELVTSFSSDLIRFYLGQDLIGNEVGAAAKNVVGIAAGILDGLYLSSLKGALMSRGTREVARLIEAMGGNPVSAYGLCHLGDYEATVFSPYSHNRAFGESIVRGNTYDALAEGYYTAAAMHHLAEELGVDLPITEAVYRILYENADAKEEIGGLFRRDIKREWDGTVLAGGASR